MALAPGTRLGPYEVLAPLGAGGMGEVYEARDTRLDRRVALKVVRSEVAANSDHLARFEREAKAVAALNHPHILTVHDVGTHEGTPYVVTELLEGESLRDVVLRRSPTQRQVLGWAVQTTQGLAAAHQKGIVHRDLKPENLFLTHDGRIKILDFGLAKLIDAGPIDAEGMTASSPTSAGVVMGTAAYMSPEQVQGLSVDARSDIFSFGVVLYELLAKKHPFRRETTTATLAAILQETPLSLTTIDASIPRALDGIVRRCLEKRREERFQGAHDLGLALEAVLAAPTGSAFLDEVEERSPYPGMSSFTEKDTAVFFGRESDAKALWERIRARPLLAVIGPSGAGKTSFLRAGVMASRPEGWAVAYATPGTNPAVGLARGLTPELAGDATGFGELLGGVAEFTNSGEAGSMLSAIKRWRAAHDEVLLIFDQFEELFTLNDPETRKRFSSLLGRLTADAGIHVVLSMRDDFLIRCSEQPALARVFEHLTPLLPVSGDGLHRALVEPARKRGFRFEDDALVDEMVKAVEGERAALPLLAFAVSRLWEKRDRANKLLTREAYAQIGGVAGALAQHAEATLDGIGGERQSVVREIFRNLVTAQGTRALCDREELLSAFPDRPAAEDVLGKLVDARLLTSYEVEGKDGATGHHRVEIVHESLLTNWPRLVRWQKQDEEGALLRDQLKQAAHLWEEKGRTGDLLWTGTAYQEFDLWRGRYPGALTAVEEDFARSMGDKARRRKRLVTAAVTSVMVGLASVAIAIGISRQQAATARDQARAETGQREAAQLLALGRLKLIDSSNAALAYAIASLERSDSNPARAFALEALWQGPSALFLSDPVESSLFEWSPDGRWLALTTAGGLVLQDRETNARRQLSSNFEITVGFTSDSRRLVTQATFGAPTTLHVWTLPDGRLEHTLSHPEGSLAFLAADRLLTLAFETRARLGEKPALVRRLSLDGTIQQVLGRWQLSPPPQDFMEARWPVDVDPSATWLASVQGGRLLQQRLDALSAPGRMLGIHRGQGVGVCAHPWRDRVVTGDTAGDIRIWNVSSARLERALKSPADARVLALDPNGRFVATGPPDAMKAHSLFLFDLAAPHNAEPAPLLGSEWTWLNKMEFSPDGSWLTSAHGVTEILWNMKGVRSSVLGRQGPPYVSVAFAPDGHLISTSDEGVIRSWPLYPAAGNGMRQLLSRPGAGIGLFLEVDHAGRFAVVTERWTGRVFVVPLDGSKAAEYELKRQTGTELWSSPSGSLSGNGRFLATEVSSPGHPDVTAIRILDLSTGDERTLDSHARRGEGCEKSDSRYAGFSDTVWLPDGRLLTDGDAGLRVWDLVAGTSSTLRPCEGIRSGAARAVTPDGRTMIRFFPAIQAGSKSSLSTFDLISHSTREITAHGGRIRSFALDAFGAVLVTGGQDGAVRVGPLTGEEPHLLFGHTGPVTSVAVSPDGQWIASGGDDGTIRLWPMPDLSKPPMHTLPHDELLAKLRSLTNLRAARDPASDTGWKIEIGPFPGWKDVPTWQP
ncbi:MAG: protein kinase [Acidobacteriota bacterium]